MQPLHGLRVVAVGATLRGGLAARLLADLGGEVVSVRDARRVDFGHAARHLWAARRLLRTGVDAGQRVVEVPDDRLRTAAERWAHETDVLLWDDDADTWARTVPVPDGGIRCAVTALAETGRPGAELLAQALSGVLDTTGLPDGPPYRVGVPIGDYAAAVNATTSIVAQYLLPPAARTRAVLEVSAVDALAAFMTPFFTQSLAGLPVSRMGNRHPSTAPWNTYPTADGTVVVCTITNAQWLAVTRMIGRADLTDDPTLVSVSARHDQVDRVDAVLAEWTRTHTTGEVVEACAEYGIPAGNVATTDQVMELHGVTPGDAGAPLPTSPLPWLPAGTARPAVPTPVEPVAWPPRPARPGDGMPAPAGPRPLSGVRVVEVGSFTAGPVCARLLAALGADVVKVETPGGDSGRGWQPTVAGDSYFFLLNNTDKQSVELNLKDRTDADVFAGLLAGADILVCNLAPGALDRLGYPAGRLRRLNPTLVTVCITGFPAGSPLATRRALDTVVQAESGVMAVTGATDGEPVKSGVSLADSFAATIGALTATAGLIARRAAGDGSYTTLSMYQAMVWLTEMHWASRHRGDTIVRAGNTSPLHPSDGVYACRDGLIGVAAESDDAMAALAELVGARGAASGAVSRWLGRRTRDQAVARLVAAGIAAAPVLDTWAAAASDILRRHQMVLALPVAGTTRPAIGIPLAGGDRDLSPHRFIGPAGAHDDDVLARYLTAPRPDGERHDMARQPPGKGADMAVSDPARSALVVGVGAMGSHLARLLADGAYHVLVDDADPARAAGLAGQIGGRAVTGFDDPAIKSLDLVILMLPNSDVVQQVLVDTDLLSRLPHDALVVDMGSSDPTRTREMARRAASSGIAYLDAPVSGGVAKAATGELTIMVGGDADTVARARKPLGLLGSRVVHVGPAGAGHALKALNNLLSAIGIMGAAEVLAVGRKWGLEPQVMLDVINSSTGRNQATEIKFGRFVLSRAFDSGFALNLMVKDMSIAMGVAREQLASVPVSAAALQSWIGAAAMLGDATADHTEVAKFVERSVGTTIAADGDGGTAG